MTFFLRQRALAAPSAVLLICRSRRLDALTLDRITGLLAWRLLAGGLQPGDVVVLGLSDPLAHVVASLACLRAGLAQISLSPDMPELQARLTLDSAGAVAALREAEVSPPSWNLPDIALSLDELLNDRSNPPDIPCMPAPQACALLVPGSGTTGRPRLIVHTYGGLAGLLSREVGIWPVQAGQRHLMLPHFGFFSAKRHLMAFLSAGGASVLPASGESIHELCQRHRVDHLGMVTVQAQALALSASSERCSMPRLQSLFVGGSPVPESLRQRIRERLSPRLVIGYGTNEMGQLATAWPACQDLHPGAVGQACPGVSLGIVDEHDRPLPPGQTGLIRARASGGACAYLNEPEATARAWRDGWFYPGDVGHITPDGTLVFSGRADDVIIFDGINIVPREIELVLEQHPCVGEAAAFPWPSALHGQLALAAVELRRDCDPSSMIEHCRQRLGVRAPVKVWVLPQLPRNSAGKVLKRELVRHITDRLQLNSLKPLN